ncbi:MAG: hypothetical protein AAF667_16120 [Pseudomonadota bacterium]
MKALRLAGAICSILGLSAPAVSAETIVLEFGEGNGTWADLPWVENGFTVTGENGDSFAAVAESYLVDSDFLPGDYFSVTRAGGALFAFNSFDIHRGFVLHDMFRLKGFLDGDEVWSTNTFAFGIENAWLTVGPWATPEMDEFRVVAAGNREGSLLLDNLSFEVARDAPVSPVPLPAGMTLMASMCAVFGVLRVRRRRL